MQEDSDPPLMDPRSYLKAGRRGRIKRKPPFHRRRMSKKVLVLIVAAVFGMVAVTLFSAWYRAPTDDINVTDPDPW